VAKVRGSDRENKCCDIQQSQSLMLWQSRIVVVAVAFKEVAMLAEWDMIRAHTL